MASTPTAPVLHHVNLKTARLEEMVRFYKIVTGMETIHLSEAGAWLTNDAANHRIALLHAPTLQDDPQWREHNGLHHTAFEFPDLGGLLESYLRIRDELGLSPHMCLDHGMTLSFYYVDPDGNSLEHQVDWFGDWSQSKEFMQSDPRFRVDPIGTFVDPDKIVDARRAGRAPDEIHREAYAGGFEPSSQPDLRIPAQS